MRTRKFGDKTYKFYGEYEDPVDAWGVRVRLKQQTPKMLVRVTPTRIELKPGEKLVVWVRKP